MFLHDERRHRIFEVPAAGARIGRDPEAEFLFPDEETLVSSLHARIYPEADGSWWLEDLGSTNGTWIRGERLTAPARLRSGDRFTLGQRGPTIAVNVPGDVRRTQEERPVDVSKPLLRLRRVKGGEDLIGSGERIVLGRGADCAIPLRTVSDTVVSKAHAVVDIGTAGRPTIRDLGSKNGTWVNGARVTGASPLAVGDRIMLGWHGPLFEVRILGGAMLPEGEGAAYRPQLQPAKTFGGMLDSARSVAHDAAGLRPGTFMRALTRQMVHESSPVFRVTVIGLLLALIVAVVWVGQLVVAGRQEAEAHLLDAERAFSEQLSTASAAQQRAEGEIARLQQALDDARRSSVSRSVLDSLARRLRAAEQRAGEGTTDFSRIAAENQRAVGLVIVRFGNDSVMGSGFIITRSGYFVTNRHVVADSDRPPVRSLEVTMADSRTPHVADIVAVSTVSDQDIAVLKIRDFRGDPVRAVDWIGREVRQGEPAAMIGFPGGVELAVDRLGYVRTSIFNGIVSKAAGGWLQFGGSTFHGVSGSPVFNAAGEVIAVHFGGYRGGQGIGFSVPTSRVRRWLPAEARAELGL